MFDEIPLDKIEGKDVQAFFDLKKPEGQRVEYKRELYRFPEQRRELLADVCSFANTFGGDLFLGINAVNGVPSGLVGVECQNPDGEISRMLEIVREWSEPTLDVHAVNIVSVDHPTEPGRVVFVIRVTSSPAAPHAGCVNKIREFFVRHGNGKEPMTATELRDAFVASETVYQRMREFRRHRVKECIHTDQDTPVLIGHDSKVVLHLFPYASFRRLISFSAKELVAHASEFPPPMQTGVGFDPLPNLDGVVNFYTTERIVLLKRKAALSQAYVQLYRNGLIEAVNAGHIVTPDRNQKVLEISRCEQILIRGLRKYIEGLRKLGIEPPVWVFPSVTGMKGVSILSDHTPHEIEDEFLLLPEFEVTSFDGDPAPLLKGACDAIYNAAGLLESWTFAKSLENAR